MFFATQVNITFNELKKEMADGLIGLHTMWNEHFGIGTLNILKYILYKRTQKATIFPKFSKQNFYISAVVEMMAAGLITIAHRSGGPLMDIIVEDPNVRNGFLAIHEKE